MGCPELWGVLRVGVRTKGAILSVAAARAKQAPITLNMCGFDRHGTPSMPSEEAISTLSRIVREGAARCLDFELYAREDSLQSLFSGFSASFDNLVSLKLDIVGLGDRYAHLTEFLQCTFPRLRRLSVNRPSIPPSCNLLQSPHFTHVCIDEFSSTSATTFSSDLLAFLQRSLGLLSLTVNIPSFTDPFVKGESSIHLPRLELLKFTTTFDNVVPLLSSISLPSRSRLDVNAYLDSSTRLAVLESEEIVHLLTSVVHAYGHVAPIGYSVTFVRDFLGRLEWFIGRCRMCISTA